MPSSSSLHDDTKPAANSSRAMEGLVCARAAQARSARLGLCFSSSMEKLRIHSAQSSLVLRWLLSHARRRLVTPSLRSPVFSPASSAGGARGWVAGRVGWVMSGGWTCSGMGAS